MKVATVLRWVGVLFVVAAAVQAFTSVNGCGSVVQPDVMRSKAACDVPLSDQRETVLLLGGAGVVLGVAGQLRNWRKRA